MATTKIPGKVRVYTGRSVHAYFELNRPGIAGLAVDNNLLRVSCHLLAERVAKPYAISISPRSDENHQHYQDSFVVEDILTGITPEAIGDPPMLRVGSRLLNGVRHAAAVEWGHRRAPNGHHVLGRTLEYLNGLNKGN